jgi:dTDP-4-amino-4,6-dideoxygalactose transaminase
VRIEPGDEVIVPPMTFAASANCIVYQGGTPVFADVEPDTLLLDPRKVEEKITPGQRPSSAGTTPATPATGMRFAPSPTGTG